MESVEEKMIGKYKIEIFPDDSPENPRKWDNLGTMICFHPRYNLGDKHDFNRPSEVLKFLNSRKIGTYLPLYLYDHSGITMNTTGFDCRWDSGQVGWIYITKEKIRHEYGCKRISKKMVKRIKGYLVNEVETYDQYLTGDVYGFRITDTETDEELDSLWGVYGFDECMDEAVSIVNHHIKREEEENINRKINLVDV